MECSNLIESALKKGNIHQSLFKGSSDKTLITDLQRTLFELGFRKELRWDDYQADGDYGKATTKAVAAFAAKNDHSSDGTSVSDSLAKLILQRHDFLPEMYILWSIHTSDLRTRKFISKGTRMSISAIQVFLNTLGYGNELNFAKFGADGLYGNSTRKAVIKYAKDNGIQSDGDALTRPVVDLFLKDINKYYGSKWSDLAAKNLPSKKSPLVLFQGSRFSGKPCRADIQFVPALEKINKYAEQADVIIHVTSSFRTTTNVQGAIVKPATFSNHLAGHGIDMNVRYGNGKFANSKVLAKYPNVPAPVKQFLSSIINDPELRWGGLFNTKDPVHIDDHLNKDRAVWRKRYEAMQKAVQLGKFN
ncbi:peptidoglycan-binding protein [Kordia sp. YSTF-M3]|uniref:Peptidoglycan-binding protein n=1 Tax=Kordia aestuariivivens TaxID=2759037 RepID=A0ABR7QDF9_9FLAO|nr:peptidoglycan-binding protein [Kordia aestuariivivens]MBC8756596.1 peptidoglycan-binding protein [Kordia aestuariivivens]